MVRLAVPWSSCVSRVHGWDLQSSQMSYRNSVRSGTGHLSVLPPLASWRWEACLFTGPRGSQAKEATLKAPHGSGFRGAVACDAGMQPMWVHLSSPSTTPHRYRWHLSSAETLNTGQTDSWWHLQHFSGIFFLQLSIAIHLAAIAQQTPNPGSLEIALLCRLIFWSLIFIYDLW